MHPFKLPNFYMPYPARLNPHLERARRHSKAWARAMGFFAEDGEAVWDEKTFDRMDFALFTAHTHPDAPGDALDTLTDWFIWGWFVDDYFPHAYGEGAEFSDARRYLERLLEFMPLDLAAATPEPANPPEHAAADLWRRTAKDMSVAWRRRCVDHIRVMAEATLREIFNQRKDPERILDPVEFVAMRREICGMKWAADLVEFSLGMEIPPDLLASRAIQVVNDVFADAGGLRNDILSYHHDVADGTRNNGVMVMQAFLACDLQPAVEVTNDLVSSRMFLFEETTAVDLPILLDRRGISPETRGQVLRYVKAVQDWMGGEFKWCMRPGGRYLPAESDDAGTPPWTTLDLSNGLTGLGTASARHGLPNLTPGIRRLKSYTHVPFKFVGPVALPDFYMPWAARVSPHAEEVRQLTDAWRDAMGLMDPVLGGGVWSRGSAQVHELSDSAAKMYPDLTKPALELAARWLVWRTYGDDYFAVHFTSTHHLPAAQAQVERLLQIVRTDGAAGAAATSALERALADLCRHTILVLPEARKEGFRTAIADMLEAWSWEVENHVRHRIADPIDYVEMRVRTWGSDMVMGLLLGLDGESIPPAVLQSQSMRSLMRAAIEHLPLANDICSYRKEIERDGEMHNGVLVIENFLDVPVERAVLLLDQLLGSRVRQFEHVYAVELPAVMDDLALDAGARDALAGCVQRMQALMAGTLDLHRTFKRYRDETKSALQSAWTNQRRADQRTHAGLLSIMRGAGMPVVTTPEPSSAPPALPAATSLYTQAARLFHPPTPQ